jgi:hypothetical protein
MILVTLLVLVAILRLLAVRQYRLKRKGEAEDSMLASLGNSISNTRISLFDVILLGIFIVTQSFGYGNLSLLVNTRDLILPLSVVAVGLFLVYGVFLFGTVRGRAYRRTEMILDDHQTLGLEDWVIQKYLAELIHQSEGDDFTRAEVARATLENLKKKENRTGDAVRRIMENPEQLKNIEPMEDSPSLWKSLRGSLLILVFSVFILMYFVINYVSGAMPHYDFFMNGIVVFLGMTLVLALCLGIEAPKARKANRKARLGI